MGSSDRFPYLTATTLDQDFLDECFDSLTCQLELIVDIESPDSGYIRASDRNKYVGDTFYRALCKFPVISRTLGDWLSPALEFGDLNISISNVDKRFNELLPGGDDFNGWIGKTVQVSLGLRDVAATYFPIFSGAITEIGGFGRDIVSLNFTARDDFDKVNKTFPLTVFTTDVFPNLNDSLVGVGVPIIYGDWTTNLTYPADVPAFVVNSEDDDVNGVTNTNNLQLVISQNANVTFDTTKVYLRREIQREDGSTTTYHPIEFADVVNVSADKNEFEIVQDSGDTLIVDASGATINYVYESGDEFMVQVVGTDLGGYEDNAVWQARHILMTFGGLSSGDFDANWASYRDKSTPAQSAIASIKCRVWEQEAKSALEAALSILEQVRLETAVSRAGKFKLTSLHFEDFDTDPDFTMTNFDVVQGSLQPRIDVRNNFNKAFAEFNRNPYTGENEQSTAVFKNPAAITQAGKEILQRVVFPNLPVRSDVENQLKEILRLSSAYIEHIDVDNTWRSALLDLGDFVKLNVNIQSTVYDNTPAMVRSISYDPQGLKIQFKLWSFQMVPTPDYAPGYAGIVGGYNATITQET